MVKSVFICFFSFRFSINSNVLVMGFKGTKGKWDARLKGQIASTVYCDNTQIYLRAKSNTEVKADMLLISKAPEILEMLQWFVENFEGVFHEGTETDNKVIEAKQLIRKATEI